MKRYAALFLSLLLLVSMTACGGRPADTPVAVQLMFMGTIPNYGISYLDGGGDFRCFALVQSGYDSSVLLEEADPNEPQFILPGTVSR